MKITLVCLITLSLLMASACEKEAEKSVNPIPADYKSWHKPLKTPVEYPIPGHGESRRIIYVNQTALQVKTLKDGSKNTVLSYPDGSIIIKEVYKREGNGFQELPQLTVMVKDKNNQDALDGWLYYVRNPGNPQAMLITNRTCVGCHEAANETHPYFDNNLQGIFRDYLFISLAK